MKGFGKKNDKDEVKKKARTRFGFVSRNLVLTFKLTELNWKGKQGI